MTEMFGEAWSPMSVPDLAPDDDDDMACRSRYGSTGHIDSSFISHFILCCLVQVISRCYNSLRLYPGALISLLL